MLNFKTVNDLNLSIINRLHDIRQLKIDLIVGIPRSGLIPASLLSIYLNLPYTDIDNYNSNRWYIRNKKLTISTNRPSVPLRILLVDDSINTGNAMRSAISSLIKNNDTVIKFAVYGSLKNKIEDIDFVCEQCSLPRAFQWNLWKHTDAKNWATDMDGVLCRDPTKKENDKGYNLENFYRTINPKFLFSKPIKYVITSREERFRKVTEEWLKMYEIIYEDLIMKPNGDPGGDDAHAIYKAKKINELGNIELYIESNTKQSRIISQLVKTPVWCVDNQTFYG